MATTKATTVLDNNVTLVAGAGNNTSSVGDLHDGHTADLFVKITNGATGPTAAAQAQVELTPDAGGSPTNWYRHGGPLTGGTTNNGVDSWTIPIPQGARGVRVVSGSNTVQDVVIRSEMVETTAVT
jgi:hypothetical protein